MAKLLKPKRGPIGNVPKLAVDDGSMIFGYDSDALSATVMIDVGDKRYVSASALSGTADYAKDAGTLGGQGSTYYAAASSFANYADKTAFTGLDTTTNDKVKLTRANGGTVQKTINHVANASTSDWAVNASTAQFANIAVNASTAVFATNASTANWAVNASTADYAQSLQGSSLKNITDAIGNVNSKVTVKSLDTATNSTIVITPNSGSAYNKIINNVANAGTADYAKDSAALGGSSLTNITDAINSATDPKAIVDIDTATNSTIIATRLNGNKVTKVINNVANAGSASWATNASTALAAIQSTSAYGVVVTDKGTTNSPPAVYIGTGRAKYELGDKSATGYKSTTAPVFIETLSANSSTVYPVQIGSSSGDPIKYRYGTGTATWSNWITVLDSSNVGSYAAPTCAYTNVTGSGTNTLTFTRASNNNPTSVVVNNVANAATASSALNSAALGGSSLTQITDKINSVVSASDAMRYLGTLGASTASPTITSLPTTAKVGSAYKVITKGTYSGIAAEVGDLFIYASTGWTLIPSGDDGNVYVGTTKSSTFDNKANNIVVATGDQRVSSVANVTASAGTLSALAATTQLLKATNGTVTTLNGTTGTFTNLTVVNTINGTVDAASRLTSRGSYSAPTSVTALSTSGFWMGAANGTQYTGYPGSYGIVVSADIGGPAFQLYDDFTPSNTAKLYVRSFRSYSNQAWTSWYKIITSADALQSSSSSIGSTSNYFTAGATTQYVAAKVSEVQTKLGNYLPISGGTLTGTLTLKGNQYTDSYSGALNANNSNLYGLNGLYFADLADSAAEGINFYRTNTTVDSLWVNTGVFYFTPNRALGSSATNYVVLHSGNVGSYAAPTSAFVNASVSNATITLTRGTGKDAKSITVNNVSNAATATSAINSTYLMGHSVVNSSSLTAAGTSGNIVLAQNIVDYISAQKFATQTAVSSSFTWIEWS